MRWRKGEKAEAEPTVPAVHTVRIACPECKAPHELEAADFAPIEVTCSCRRRHLMTYDPARRQWRWLVYQVDQPDKIAHALWALPEAP